jgi:1-acyl-sn-glycerol-3-phosphate acyltransferase
MLIKYWGTGMLSIFSYLLLLTCATITFVPAIILLLMPVRWRESSRFFYTFLYLIYRTILWCTFLPISTKGKHHIPQEPAIIAVNHQSSLDIPLVGAAIGVFPHVWLAFGAFFKKPFCHFLLSRLALPIDMQNVHAGMRSLVHAITYVQQRRMHVIIFPEGGRYTDGTIHDFYAGFVMLAKKTGRPVVPVCLHNAGRVYPPGAFMIVHHPIRVIIGSPMKMGQDESDDAFKQRVYAWFEESCKESW